MFKRKEDIMSKNDIPNIDPVSNILNTEQAKNLTNPPCKSFGTALGDLCDLCFGGLHEKAEKSRLIRKKNLEEFKKTLADSVDNIPEENQIEPKESIILPALDTSKYYLDEKEIRNMFEKLIVNSMDNRMATKVHPSFAEIIKQMSPLDAQNLKLFQTKIQYPILQLKIIDDKNRSKLITSYLFISNPNCDDIDLQNVSISSLSRLGLIETIYSGHLSNDDYYKPFFETQYYKCLKEEFDKINHCKGENNKLAFNKGYAQITPLGESFIDVCLSPLPNESNP